jgi:nicotinic acid mononucleotide adenylyltransferase
MDADTRILIEALHRAPYKYVLATTGGGTGAAGLLLSLPGGSRTVLEGSVPYHPEALIEFLAHKPEQFCSVATSREMAVRAYERAFFLAPGEPVLGIGSTVSLVSDRPKRGDHRVHVTVQGGHGSNTYSLILHKGARDREAEEAIVDAIILNALAEAVGVAARLRLPLLPDEVVQVEATPPDLVAALVQNQLAALCVQIDGRISRTAALPAAMLSGSFNPMHEGHWRLAEVAAAKFGGPVAFELSATNVDKPSLTVEEVRRRLEQFSWRAVVWATRASTFQEKATLFPGVTFIVGVDTLERLVAARYYQDSEDHMLLALEQIRQQGCRFLVAGRRDGVGNFVSIDDLKLPAVHRDLFDAIPQAEFDSPISSTALRKQAETTVAATDDSE